MKKIAAVLISIAIALAFLQCSKKGTPGGRTGTRVLLNPINLIPPPAGSVYEGWVITMARIAGPGFTYVPNFRSFGRFGWNSYAYSFVDATTAQPRGFEFETGTNFFSENLTTTLTPAQVENFIVRAIRGDTINLVPVTLAAAEMKVLLITIEPASESGPDLTRSGVPFLGGLANDSGIIDLVYPVNYKSPDVKGSYFIATPSDTLFNLFKDTTEAARINESRGLWLGLFDATGAKVDTFLRNLVPFKGWRFEAWFAKGTDIVSLGRFYRADSSDLSNSHCLDTSRIFQLPGEDFVVGMPPGINNALGGKIMVTLEPEPDADPAIFPLILFQDTTPSSIRNPFNVLNIHKTDIFDNRSRFFPKVRAFVREEK